jgi:hypothetical protein
LNECPVFVVKISSDVRSMPSSIRRNAAVQGTEIGGPGDRPRRALPWRNVIVVPL